MQDFVQDCSNIIARRHAGRQFAVDIGVTGVAVAVTVAVGLIGVVALRAVVETAFKLVFIVIIYAVHIRDIHVIDLRVKGGLR